MIDITLQNFEAELIGASQKQPVLLDIWAPWCGPCRTLGPSLEKLEEAYAGRFALAKLNSDEVPEIATQLSQMFGVRSIPFCVMFVDGQRMQVHPMIGPITHDANALLIGNNRNGTMYDEAFIGRLDDVMIYDRALDDAEVAALFAGERPSVP